VGANTLRLLVAAPDGGGVVGLSEERVQLGLGEEIESRGHIGEEKLEQAAATARSHVRKARKLGCVAVEVLVTSPGRQAENGDQLVRRLAEATGIPTRVLSATEEAELAWRGACAAATDLPETVAICDVGGGSTQIAVGTPSAGPSWTRSVELGSLRLTRRAFRHDPPDKEDLTLAQEAVGRAFADIAPPRPLAAIAVGGSARALRRVAGDRLTEDELIASVRRLSKRRSRKIAKTYGVDEARAQTMTAGALIFIELERKLGVPMQVGRGGVREGAAQTLLADVEAAA